MERLQNSLKVLRNIYVKYGHQPEKYVLFFGALFGLLFVCLIPPMQGGDEPNHFYRAYQVSTGDVVSEYVENSVGGTLPTSIVQFGRASIASVTPGNMDSKMTLKKFQALAKIKDDGTKSTVTFSNTAVYSPVAYTPHVVGIWIGRLLGTSPIVMLYLTRLCGLIFALTLIVIAMRLLPFGKLPFAIAALIPMTISQISIVSADTTVLAFSFLAVALTLHFAYRDQDLKWQDIGLLVGVFILLGLTKPGLFPLVLITIALLRNKAIHSPKAWKVIAGCAAAALITTVLWNSIIKKLAVFGYEADILGASYSQQLHFITHQPLQYIRVLYESFFTLRFNDVTQSFYGKFGWLDTPIPLLFIMAGFVVISLSIFISSQSEDLMPKLPRWVRLAALLGALGIIIVSVTSQYLFYVPVKKAWIFGLQGRYFLPPLLLFIVAFIAGRKTMPKQHFQNLSRRLLVSAVALLCVATIVIASRYFHMPRIVPCAKGVSCSQYAP